MKKSSVKPQDQSDNHICDIYSNFTALIKMY